MLDERKINEVLKSLCSKGYDCFASEAQLRDAFAIELGRKEEDFIVIPEYTQVVPKKWRCSEKDVHFDLFVIDRKANENILLEFKYKTKNGLFKTRNGMLLDIRDNKDTTNGRYAIWRDIYRIEEFISNSNAIKIDKGFVIFITNINAYSNPPKNENKTIAGQFSVKEGYHLACDKYWNTEDYKNCTSINDEYRKDKQPLKINNKYYFNYSNYSTLNDEKNNTCSFEKLIVPIFSKDYENRIQSKLEGIGKNEFINHFDDFKTQDLKKCKNILISEGRTENAALTRSSKAISLFKEHNEIQAIRNILSSSNRIDDELKKRTLELLKRELK